MTAKIYCRTTAKDTQSYYLAYGKENYFLFDCAFRRSNKEFFAPGRYIDEILDARRHASKSVRRISVRLIGYAKYIESEHGISIFQQTARKKAKKRSNKMARKSEMQYKLAVA